MIKAWNQANRDVNRPKPATRRVNIHDTISCINEADEEAEDVDPEAMQEITVADLDANDAAGINDSTQLLAHITNQQALPPSHNIRSLLASTHNRRSANTTQLPANRKNDKNKEQIVLNGKRFVQADNHQKNPSLRPRRLSIGELMVA